jgi:hypothetical protein
MYLLARPEDGRCAGAGVSLADRGHDAYVGIVAGDVRHSYVAARNKAAGESSNDAFGVLSVSQEMQHRHEEHADRLAEVD